MTRDMLDRLWRRVAAVGASLCVGIDPDPRRLPSGLTANLRGVESFAMGLLEVAAEHAAAVKLNAAFFEALGPDGWSLLGRLRRATSRDLVFILDAKRGDIGSTAERYAHSAFGVIDADAITLSPYLGEDAIEPFLEHSGRGVYILARTSNPSAERLQSLTVDGAPLHLHVARWVADQWSDGRVGLVVGATSPEALREIRDAVPGLAFLIPGVGAQGGDLESAARLCHGALAPGLVAISRGIAEASRGEDWLAAARAEAGRLVAALREAV
jgi:orotidine 5'-phosphate decarboxylase subfamily 2